MPTILSLGIPSSFFSLSFGFSEVWFFDLLGDNEPNEYVEAGPTHEAHVAFSVDGMNLNCESTFAIHLIPFKIKAIHL